MQISAHRALRSVLIALSAIAIATFGTSFASMMSVSMQHPGMTGAYYNGSDATEVYTRNFYCDKTVPSKASSGCEVGQHANRPPPGHYDPEYAIVPIGFAPADAMQMNCRPHVVCVAHPATIDMTRVANALAMTMKISAAALMPKLRNAPVPGHNHYLTTLYGGKPQWWNVVIIGVTSPAEYKAVVAHRSYSYIEERMAKGDSSLLKPAATNLFLYFAAHPGRNGM